jgi:hypothetical protein
MRTVMALVSWRSGFKSSAGPRYVFMFVLSCARRACNVPPPPFGKVHVRVTVSEVKVNWNRAEGS